jgi:hypothetical protein
MTENIEKERNPILAIVASSLFHLLLFVIAYFFTDLHLSKINPNSGYVQVFTRKGNPETINFEKNIVQQKKKKADNQNLQSSKESEQLENSEPTMVINFLDENADTASLKQIYSEPTLNVTVNFPIGWTFLDQNVEKKLDGVTFWANNSNVNPPPYVHLEVCDPSLFNESRYKHNLTLRDATMYFNDPENLANYFSQTFYFRTKGNEDFSLKLTIKGEEAFKSFTPTFYGMLKSFRFSKSLF